MTKTDFIHLFIILCIGVFIMSVLYLFMSVQCINRWPTSMSPQFGIFSGCTIETREGRIPAQNYRVL